MKKIVAIIIFLLIIAALPTLNVFCNDNLMPIMGQGTLEAENMYYYLLSGNDPNGVNPISEEYAREFVAATINMSNAEGVNYDVVFVLMMHETGFLNFGGDVVPVQNNFGGLGTTGGGVQGAYFDDVNKGILAVAQHLKCYASDQSCNLEIVDPRWDEGLRLKAVYVEHLGYNDNPNGAGWAVPGDGYGARLIEMIEEIRAIDPKAEETKRQAARYPTEEPADKENAAKKIQTATLIFLCAVMLLLIVLLFITKNNVKTKRRNPNIR